MKKAIKGLAVTATTFAAVATLAACVPGTADKAKTKLEKAGYKVEIADSESLSFMASMLGVNDLESVMEASKDSEYVMVYYFSTTDSAKKFYDDVKKEAEDADDIIKRSGKVVYGGTETAVKDFD